MSFGETVKRSHDGRDGKEKREVDPGVDGIDFGGEKS
jgi:hypothetical protein